jgi:hypothetical protein
MKRSPLAQFWPQLRKAALIAIGTTCSSSSSLSVKGNAMHSEVHPARAVLAAV